MSSHKLWTFLFPYGWFVSAAYDLLHVYVNSGARHRFQLGYLYGDVGGESALQELRLRTFTSCPPRFSLTSAWQLSGYLRHSMLQMQSHLQ